MIIKESKKISIKNKRFINIKVNINVSFIKSIQIS